MIARERALSTPASRLLIATLPLLLVFAACSGSDSPPRPQPRPDVVADVFDDVDFPDTPTPSDVEPTDHKPGPPDDTTDTEDVDDPTDVEEVTDTAPEVVVPECTEDEDCDDHFDDLGPCEFAYCSPAGECERDLAVSLDCCLVDADCDDGDPDTVGTCPVPGEPCHIDDVTERCTSHDWCVNAGLFPDKEPCERARCNFQSGECFLETIAPPSCCVIDDDCDDGNPATLNWCPTPGGSCSTEYTGICDVVDIPLHISFDSGSIEGEGLLVDDWHPDDNVTWNITTKNSYRGNALYLGDPECRWFYNGPRDVTPEGCVTDHDPIQDPDYATGVRIDLYTPEFTLMSELPYMLSLWISGAGEWSDPDVGWKPDNLRIFVEDTDLTRTLVFETAEHPYRNQIPSPTLVAADLTAFAGKRVRLLFSFDSLGPEENRHEGWTIDEIKVATTCDDVECSNDADCLDDGNACTQNVCTLYSNFTGGSPGVCAYSVLPSDCVPCFEGAQDCDDGDPCTIESCVAGVCAWHPNPAPECCAPIHVLDEDFDPDVFPDVPGQDISWTIEDDGTDVKWQLFTDADTGETSLYFGDPVSESFDNGQVADGRAILGPVTLPNPDDQLIIHLVARFDLLLSTQWDLFDWHSVIPLDRLTLFVRYMGAEGMEEEEVWSSAADNVQGTTDGEWRALGVDLTDYVGETVWFVWQFNTYDPNDNPFGGVWIDNFAVETVCSDICVTDAECDDGDDCTFNVCDSLVCRNDLKYLGCCTTVDDCLPGNACTDVKCENSKCVYTDDRDPSTCCEGIVWRDRFNDPTLTGYEVHEGEHGDPANEVRWQAVSFCNTVGSYALYFGDKDKQHYATPHQVSGSVTTPSFRVPVSGPDSKSYVQFDLFLDTEWSGARLEGWENPPALLRDRLAVYSVVGTSVTKLWDSYSMDFRGSTCETETSCDWKKVQIDLTSLQDYSLKLRFEFDSMDDLENLYLGACVDNLEVYTACDKTEYECFRSEDCDDGDPVCTWNFCVDNKCETVPTGDPICCYDETVHATNWDSGQPEGWELRPEPGGDFPVTWNIADFLPGGGHSGQYFLYFGDPTTETFDDPGQQVGGFADYPSLQLPQSERITLTFWYYVDVSPWDPSAPSKDDLRLTIFNNYEPQEAVLWDKADIPTEVLGVQPPQWTKREVDITAFAGANVAFQFDFDSGDISENTGMGVLIDSWEITAEICP